jgi:hypothetical protein
MLSSDGGVVIGAQAPCSHYARLWKGRAGNARTAPCLLDAPLDAHLPVIITSSMTTSVFALMPCSSSGGM